VTATQREIWRSTLVIGAGILLLIMAYFGADWIADKLQGGGR